jgi:hypothetical protein
MRVAWLLLAAVAGCSSGVGRHLLSPAAGGAAELSRSQWAEIPETLLVDGTQVTGCDVTFPGIDGHPGDSTQGGLEVCLTVSPDRPNYLRWSPRAWVLRDGEVLRAQVYGAERFPRVRSERLVWLLFAWPGSYEGVHRFVVGVIDSLGVTHYVRSR